MSDQPPQDPGPPPGEPTPSEPTPPAQPSGWGEQPPTQPPTQPPPAPTPPPPAQPPPVAPAAPVAPQPNWNTGTPPVQSKSGCGKFALIFGIIGAVLLVLVGGCIGVMVFVVNAVNEPVDQTNEFFSAVKAGDFDEAADMYCSKFSADDAEADIEFTFGSTDIEGYNFTEFDSEDDEAIVEGTVEVDGEDIDTTVYLENDDGWCVSLILSDSTFDFDEEDFDEDEDED